MNHTMQNMGTILEGRMQPLLIVVFSRQNVAILAPTNGWKIICYNTYMYQDKYMSIKSLHDVYTSSWLGDKWNKMMI